LPASSEKPPVSWIAPRMMRTQPILLRLSRMNLFSLTKMFALSSAPMP
jgi:hypothetical protein